ncbi:MAG: hypothetical protein QXO71_06155 [Candidatus Jordarchaeaceae archaeon]
MPIGIFVISFLDEIVSLDYSIFHTDDVTREDIQHIFLGMEIEKGTVQHLFTSSFKILYYAITINEKEALMGMVLRLKEKPELFEKPLREEAESLLQKERDENFATYLKSSYQNIVQKAIKSIEEEIGEIIKKEEEEEKKNIKKAEEELKKLYAEEKELLAKLEREGETDSIMEKIEAVMTKQKQLEEIIQKQKSLETPKEDYSDLKEELIELKELYNKINEFQVVQEPIKTEEVTKKEVEQKETEPPLEAPPSSDISDLLQRLQTLSTKQSTLQSETVSIESPKALEESKAIYEEKIETPTVPPSSSSEVLTPELESEEARISRILTERFGKAKGIILEYLFWIKKPRTIAEISQDLEISAEKIVEPADELTKNGYVCQMTKKKGKEIYLTVCPSCPLKLKCGRKSSIDWNEILSKTV